MEIDPQSARQLFQAVVTKALVDATSAPKRITQKVLRRKAENDIDYEARRQQVLIKRQAHANAIRDDGREWLTNGRSNFEMICSLAGYNPDDIRARSLRLAERGWPSLPVEMSMAA